MRLSVLFPAVIFWSLLPGLRAAEVTVTSAPDARPPAESQAKTLAEQATTVTATGLAYLDDLLREALQNNRDILAAQKKYEAARLRPSQASSLPDPVLSFASRNIGNPIPLTQLGTEPMSAAGVMFMQSLPFPGKLTLKGKIATKMAEAEWQSYQAVQLRVVSQLRQDYRQLHFLYQAIEVIQKDEDLLEKFEKIAQARYMVGKGIQQDVLKAQVELSLLDKRLTVLEQQKGDIVAQINALLNRPPETPLGRPADYRMADITKSLDELYRLALDRSPHLARDQAMVERNTYETDLAKKEYLPDFGASAGYFSRGYLSNAWDLRVDVKIPLYFWRKQRPAAQESAQSLLQAKRQYESTEQALFSRVKGDYLAAKASRELVDLYGKAIIPQATLALESSMASYEVGRTDFLTVVTNFLTVLQLEIEYYSEFANYHKAVDRLEELTAQRITS